MPYFFNQSGNDETRDVEGRKNNMDNIVAVAIKDMRQRNFFFIKPLFSVP
jgi:hypothetical protein